MSPSRASAPNSGERYKQCECHEILSTYRGQSVSLANLLDMTSLAASGWLQNANMYCTTVRQTGAAGMEAYNSVTV